MNTKRKGYIPPPSFLYSLCAPGERDIGNPVNSTPCTPHAHNIRLKEKGPKSAKEFVVLLLTVLNKRF